MWFVTLGLAVLLSTAARGDAPPSDAPPSAMPSIEAPSSDPPRAPAATKEGGLDPAVIGALQLGAACATYVVALPSLVLTSYVCPFVSCGLCLAAAAVGYVGTWVGDRFGTKRAPAVWPIVAAYGGLLMSGLGAGALYYGAMTNGTPLFLMIGAGGMLAGFAASAIGVPIAYAVTAEDKDAGDDGSAMPGLLVPAHPIGGAERVAPKTPSARPSRPHQAPLPDLPPPPLLEPQGALRLMRF